MDQRRDDHDVDRLDRREPPAERYAAWADRLRAKRTTAKQRIDEVNRPGTRTASSGYWSTDNVYRESARLADHAATVGPSVDDAHAALAVLDLPAGTSIGAVESRYRELAKVHHPDRHVDADPSVRDHHARMFRAVNEARAVLRRTIA